MSNESITSAASETPVAKPEAEQAPGFFRRYRLPLVLGFVAICLYATSILYILYGRGQVV
ncbi:MAG: hypothetical protein AB8B79_16840 [Granulosicoccus sp.]